MLALQRRLQTLPVDSSGAATGVRTCLYMGYISFKQHKHIHQYSKPSAKFIGTYTPLLLALL